VTSPTRLESRRSGRWQVETWLGSAAALHALDWPEPLAPTVWVFEVERPALVLGSAQRPADVDHDALDRAGIDLAQRRSGGGAVLVEPGAGAWIDVLIPRGDLRWDDDVLRSFPWLGQAWVDALADLGLAAEVHRGALACGAWGRQVCFAAIGSGEVTIDGAKAIGLSQRRTRTGARFQCNCYRRWHPEPLAALGVEPSALPSVAVVDFEPAAIVAALLAHLD
jgi:lipoate-protein ligase A